MTSIPEQLAARANEQKKKRGRPQKSSNSQPVPTPANDRLRSTLNEIFETPYSCTVLQECIELQTRKAHDYQNPNSTVKQIDYYPHGLISLYDIMNAKLLRVRSLMESGASPNHEGIDDSLRDLINYASFAVSYIHKKLPGQTE